jgi:hypothetical protein
VLNTKKKKKKKYLYVKKTDRKKVYCLFSPTLIIISVTHKQMLEIKRYALPCYDDGHANNETLSVEKRTLRAAVYARIFLFLQRRMAG